MSRPGQYNLVNYIDPSGNTGEFANARAELARSMNRFNRQGGSAGGSQAYVLPSNPIRSANAVEREGHQTYSDPTARSQSQGHRPQPCGLGDFLAGLGNSLKQGNLLPDLMMAALRSQPALRSWMQRAETWLDWQVAGARQLFRDPRTLFSLGVGASTALILAGLAATAGAALGATAGGVGP